MENELKLVLNKSADKSYVLVGDKITYSIKAINKMSIPLNGVIIYDLLNEALEIIHGSVKVDNLAINEASVLTGVCLNTIAVGQTKELTFEAEVLLTQKTIVDNTATGVFNYQLIGGPILEGKVLSNTYTLQLYRASLELTKKADKEEVLLGDKIGYKVKLINDGNVIAYNVLFKDIVSKQEELIQGSFKINSRVVNGIELDKGVLVGNIHPGEELVLDYEMKVLGSNCSGILINSAGARFQYQLPNGVVGRLMAKGNNHVVETNLAIMTFKQMSIEAYLSIPQVKPDSEAINVVTGVIDHTSYHVIETAQAKSTEGQRLTGYKLIVTGSLNLIMEYTALDRTQSVHSAHYVVPFSTFIILPPNYSIGSKIEVTGLVEDIYYKEIDIRNFFTNTTALINVKILSC